MIPVRPADEPSSFDASVRKRGEVAIRRLLGKRTKSPGRKPKVTYTRPKDIPSDKFPAYWTEARKADGKSALDDMMDAYDQRCAYLAMRLERATGSPTIDHFVPKSRDWRLVYEWSNYRLSASCVNGAKGDRHVIDPFEVEPGWFELDLDTYLVRGGPNAPASLGARMGETLKLLNLRQCVRQRGETIERYLENTIDLRTVERYAPFIAAELRRQRRLARGDV
jgi:hypothetical protein